MLELRNVTKTVGAAEHIDDVSLTLRARLAQRSARPDAVRQDQPDAADGRARSRRPPAAVSFDGKDVTGVPVQKRNVAMVYQQFINYPALTVYENIASPLRVAGVEQAKIDRQRARGRGAAEADAAISTARRSSSPAASSSAPRSRAPSSSMPSLVLLDEPLANLDYKLREELREELPRIFAATGAIFVYATTEPHRGAAARRQHGDACREGRITQFGPTLEVFRRPNRPGDGAGPSPIRR